jgi:hypothetical protein
MDYRVSHAGMGLGGRAAINVTPYLRIGGMGFRSSCTYETPVEKRNFIEITFGGITAEYLLTLNKLSFSTGICGGGGHVNHLHTVTVGTPYSTVFFISKGTLIIQPFVTSEFKLTNRISASIMLDWLFTKALAQSYSFGPAVHAGILFGR